MSCGIQAACGVTSWSQVFCKHLEENTLREAMATIESPLIELNTAEFARRGPRLWGSYGGIDSQARSWTAFSGLHIPPRGLSQPISSGYGRGWRPAAGRSRAIDGRL